MTCGRLALLVMAVGLVLGVPASAEAKLSFKRCGQSTAVRCGRFSVPLDRSGAVPGRISLFVTKVLARRRGGANRPPVVLLAGGPGQSASDAFLFGLEPLAPLYRNRDMVIFDQRGTGRSGLLRCRALERSNLLRAGDAAAACARRLGPRRAFYTSRDSTDDIDALRAQLGAEKVALYGTSYSPPSVPRGIRSTTTPPIKTKSSMGSTLKTRTALMAVAEPVFSSTHHAIAI